MQIKVDALTRLGYHGGVLCIVALLAQAPVRTVLWDGNEHAAGTGWIGGITHKATLETVPAEKAADRFVRFHTTEANKFAEWGWQWAAKEPTFEGTDFGPYETIEFGLRVTGPVIPRDLQVSLASAGDRKTSPRTSLRRIEPNFTDGEWHKITVPLALFRQIKGKYDQKHTTQVIFGTWNGAGGDFTADLRDIVLEPPAKK